MANRLGGTSAALEKRLQEWKRLRDGGTLPVDAARELGVSYETGQRYERWYRRINGIPQRRPGERRVPGEPRVRHPY